MYEAFYGLREKPFNLTPDPKFLYLSEKHKEAFAHLLFGIKNRSGFVMVTGEIGTGKTTICRTLLNQLDETTEVAFIFNPYMSPEELLSKINEEFGIRSQAASVRGLIDELNAYLLDRNAQGKNCVLVIDEAQNLTPGVLEQIRLLSNLETETTKLLQIVLIGQPELMQHLSLEELRQLNQRITARYHLHPLDAAETLQYIAYRLRVAGGRRRVHFSPSAVRLVYKLSKGTPRVINAICDRALLIGYTQETRDISAKNVRQAWREICGEAPKPAKKPVLRRLIPGPTLLATVALIAVAGKFGIDYVQGRAVEGAESPVASAASIWEKWSPFRKSAPPADSDAPRETRSDDTDPGPAPATPVKMEAPTTAGDFPPTLAGLVDRQDPAESRNGAAVGILRAWNLALLTDYPADDSVESIAAFAKASRMICEQMPLTMEQLEAINLPAMVRLHGDRQSIWSAVTRIEFDEYRITSGMSETTLIPKDAFRACYQNEALVFWRDPSPSAAPLRVSSTGEDVRVLQAQLRALGRLKKKPDGQYDAATAEAVRKLQQETGLTADGVLGPQTRMVLYSWLPGFSTPALRPLPPLVLGGNDEESRVEEKPTVAKKETPPAPSPEKPESPPAPAAEQPAAPPSEQPAAAQADAPAPADSTNQSNPSDSEAAAPADPAAAKAAEAPAPDVTALPPAPPVPEGPVDPFATLGGTPAVTAEELDQPKPPTAPAPETPPAAPPPGEDGTAGKPAEATAAPGEGEPADKQKEDTAAPKADAAAPAASGAKPPAKPPAAGAMPLVPSTPTTATPEAKKP
ncbi:MAG: AAA family ATPase [Candidatus Hydrogenedentes bacterium]|nr:AAA family ATPase [Candidatus Hydrogenedentota bacterium]